MSKLLIGETKNDFELFKKGFSINVKQKNRDKKKVEFHSFRQRQPRFRGYFRRNEYMVRKADTVIAYWDLVPKGGTFYTVSNALESGKPVINLYERMK